MIILPYRDFTMIASTQSLATSLCISLAALLVGCSGGATYQVKYEQAEAAARGGDYEKAIELLNELAQTSKNPAVFGSRANCYSSSGNLDAALTDYQTAFDLANARTPNGTDPILPYLYYNRGVAYDRANKHQLAIADYEKTIQTRSDYPDVKNNLAWLLATCPDSTVRNSKRAVELADQELRRAPEDPSTLDTVAACYAAADDFPRATATQEKAVSLCLDPAAKQRFQSRLDLYRNRKPFVDAE
ncbi:MAG: tetratricopeptide repeat protein [Planctomycetaceae bacterium]|nr:tetratricopeptide repeat protein [Planctomycetaceae bacterium]